MKGKDWAKEWDINDEEPAAKHIIAVVQKTPRRWFVILECGHSIPFWADSILKIPIVFFCAQCSNSKSNPQSSQEH